MELFRLDVVTDNPLFEGFGLVNGPSMLGRKTNLDDMLPGLGVATEGRSFKPLHLASVWEPPKVTGRVAAFQDFPGVDMILPAFSIRACNSLRDLLEPNGELLPLKSDAGEYYFYNITRFSDALDTEAADGAWSPYPLRAIDFHYFAFDEDKLAGLSIFRIYECPIITIVTDEFVRRVYEAGLNGFHFRKIWPLPPGVHWKLEAMKKEKRKRAMTQKLKKHTLVVILPLIDKKPSDAEKKKIKRLENELDAQLMVASLDAPYFGSYEGSDTVNNEYRIFITCPDVDALVRKLHPWLYALAWSGPFHVMKRYGEMRDVNAREELMESNA